VPVEEWDKAAKAADIGFAKTAYWEDALGSLGLDHSAIAVAYDDGRMTNAARVWFILQYFGVKAVILNGGWPVLSSATGLPAGTVPPKSGFRGIPGSGSVGLVLTVTRMCSTRVRALSLPVRDMRNRARVGHLPGARHLSHTVTVRAERLQWLPEETFEDFQETGLFRCIDLATEAGTRQV